MKKLAVAALFALAAASVVVANGFGTSSTARSRVAAMKPFVFGPDRFAGSNADPIKIGASTSLTGVQASSGSLSLRGYQLYVANLNKHGGLLKRPVQLVYYDDQSSAATSALLYEKLINEDQVDLLVGPYSSPITQAAAAIPEKYHKVMIDPQAAASSIYDDKQWNVQAVANGGSYLRAVADICKTRKYNTLAIFTNNAPAQIQMTDAIEKRAEALGMKVAFQRTYPGTTSDFSSIVLAAKSANADCIVGATSVADAIGLVREVNRQGLKPKLLAMAIGTSEPTFQSSLGDLANGVIGNTQWWPSLKRPGNKEFVAAYRKTFSGDPDYHVALSYSAIQVLATAVTQVKSLDQTKIRQALGRLNLKTIAGPFKVNSGGLQSGYKTYFMQWQNGKPYLVWPNALAERKLKLPYS